MLWSLPAATREAAHLFHTLDVRSEDDYRKLPRRDRYLWDVSWFEGEVMNGGVDQYLTNSTGDHWAECLEALNAIGAKDSYRLLKQACDLFPGGRPSRDEDIRHAQLRELAKSNPVDDLIAGEIEEDLYQYLLDYYRSADAKAM
jgi:hypothetical protein